MLSSNELKKITASFNSEKESLLVNSFKAIGDNNRHRIFRLLSVQGKMSASSIAETLGMSRPLTSQHLKILEQARLFKKMKIGLHHFYQLDQQNFLVRALSQTIKKFNDPNNQKNKKI